MTGQKGMYEIRIYNERYNMDRDYYEGDEDIRTRIICRSIEKLIESWKMLLEENEGETYSVWDGPDILVGGAYDPGDLDVILENLGMIEKEDGNEV